MSRLIERKQNVIAAVAKGFSATLERGGDPRDVYLIVAGKRIAIEVMVLDSHIVRNPSVVPPRLRFDRVVLRLLERLRAALQDAVPKSWTVVLTVTAPIRLPSKTAAVLEEKIRELLRERSAPETVTDTVHGNQIQICIMRGGKISKSKLVGFVHNRDSDPTPLFDLTGSLLRSVGSVGRTRASFSGDRWLVIIANERSWLETYRQICSQLFTGTDFRRVLLVGADGEVLTLVECRRPKADALRTNTRPN